MQSPKDAVETTDTEIIQTRIFDAQRDLVFEVWTDPKHLANWWGPNGFRLTTYSMDVRPGGVWRFCMHGPDGTDYQNKVTYLEVKRPERIAFSHGGDDDCEPAGHQTTATFESIGNQTKVVMRMTFVSKQAEDFVISRTFDAPRALVWKAWTERQELMRWFGPKGFTMTTANMDFRPGGHFLYELAGPNGAAMWGKWVFREIIPPEKIVLVHSFSDARGNLTRHPMAPVWPLQTLSRTTFEEKDGKTILRIHWSPLDATPEERAIFGKSHESMNMGWGGTFDQLDEYLAGVR